MQVTVPPWSHSELQGYREGRKHRSDQLSIHPLSLSNGPSDSKPLYPARQDLFFFFFFFQLTLSDYLLCASHCPEELYTH